MNNFDRWIENLLSNEADPRLAALKNKNHFEWVKLGEVKITYKDFKNKTQGMNLGDLSDINNATKLMLSLWS